MVPCQQCSRVNNNAFLSLILQLLSIVIYSKIWLLVYATLTFHFICIDNPVSVNVIRLEKVSNRVEIWLFVSFRAQSSNKLTFQRFLTFVVVIFKTCQKQFLRALSMKTWTLWFYSSFLSEWWKWQRQSSCQCQKPFSYHCTFDRSGVVTWE